MLRPLLLSMITACSGASPPAPDAVLPTTMPARLSETELYADIGTKTLASGTVEFTPANVLWSDGATKRRWIQLPEGKTIDTRDLDHWVFPVGTKLFKEFSRDGKRLETRVIWRVGDTGNREADTLFGAFVWDDTESEAYFVKDGAVDVRGTDHDVPAAAICWKCHIGEPGHVLGFSALQLGNLDGLALSDPPPAGTTFVAPDPALGYLHVNCGGCHNPNGSAWPDSQMILRLDVAEHDPATTNIVKTTVGVPLEQWIGRGFTYRVVAGDPAASAILYRMSVRATNVQMPPIATKHVDDVGVALIQAWIQAQ